MQRQVTAHPRDRIIIARGYGLKIYVERGHLIIHDGVGRCRETRRFHRASRQISRLILLGHSGYITLEAIRWLNDVGAGLMHVDADGRLLATSIAVGPNLPALRRAQAFAADGPAGLETARYLLAAKVAGQLAILGELAKDQQLGGTVQRALMEIEQAGQLADLLRAEAQAANAYWDAWSAMRIPFPERESTQLPEHWLTFGQRASLLTGGPQLATNPAGAILNYLYTLLEAETILACHAVGLDTGLGVFHTDRRDRAALAQDAMEAVRPAVDAYLLALLTQRTLSPRDFTETRRGSCRLHERVTTQLASTCGAWRKQIAPVVERVAHIIAGHSPSRVPRLTPLTGTNWKTAWDDRKADRHQRRPRTGGLELPDNCRDCGVELPSRRHRYCVSCRKRRWDQDAHVGRQSAARVLSTLRAEKRDPGHGGEAAKLRGSKNAAHQRAVRDWTGERPDPAVFTAEILPRLRNIPLPVLAAATGLSEHYCSLIRLGKRVPHARHWEPLRKAVLGQLQNVATENSGGTRPADTPASRT
jgi:CRISPR-associated endonuclease Cas1